MERRGDDKQPFVASGNDGFSSSKRNRMMILFIVFIAFISGMFFRFTIRHPDPYNLEKPNLRDTNSFALHALAERKLDAPWTSINVICGLAQNYVDENGITWVPDDIYAKGGKIRTSTTIANHLGANERYWDVVIPNYSGEQVSVPTLGVYTVTIYLSEIYYRESEKRLFNIAVGDETMKTLFTRNIDLYATYGYGSLQAFDIDVTVTTGWINIWVVNVSAGDPKISAFSIIYKSSSGPVRDAKISTLSVIDKSSQAFASPTRLPSKFPTRFPSKKPTRSPTRAPKTISKPPTLYPKTTASSRIPSALPTTKWSHLFVICGTNSFTDAQGVTWVPDAPLYAKGGSIAYTAGIANPIAATERYWSTVTASSFGEQIVVGSPGIYTVTIYLAERYFRQARMRLFNINVGDATLQKLFAQDIDLFAQCGYGNLCSFPVDVIVTSGVISINMVMGAANSPKLSGFSVVFKSPLSSSPTAKPTNMKSQLPSASPTVKLSIVSTSAPSAKLSSVPSSVPTLSPSFSLSVKPIAIPTAPSGAPTQLPSACPSTIPTVSPSLTPTYVPSTQILSTAVPTALPSPGTPAIESTTYLPTLQPSTGTLTSDLPYAHPSTFPTAESTSGSPSAALTEIPTFLPTTMASTITTPSSALSTTPTVDPIEILSSCLGPHLASQLYSPHNPGAGLTSFDWLQSSANSHIPMNPVAVLLLPNITFAAKAVTCAAVSGIQPVIRSGGHSSEGSSSLSNKLVIDLSYCNNLVSIFESPVGSGNYQAKFEAGMKLGQLYSALFSAGEWTIVGGVCPYVGAGGQLTGGGMGMLTRQYGLGIDQLTAVDIVVADGKSLTTNSTTNSDLFWALRGGGGASFGLVTHFTTHLFKLPTASMFFLKFSCSAEMLNLWQTFFVTAPNGVNAQFQMGISDTNINGQYDGPLTGPDGLQTLFQNAGILTMKTLVWHQFRTCSGLNARAFVIGGLNCAPDDLKLLYTYPIEPNAKDFHKSKTDNFNALMPQNVLQEIANMLLADPNTNIYGHSLGGNGLFASQSSSATPFFDRSAWHTIEYHYDSPVQNHYYPGSASYIWLNRISALVKPYTSGRKYLNYLDFDLPQNYGEMYWGWDNLQRLVSVKNKYDPTNFPQSIPLALNYSSSEPTANPSAVPTFESTATPTAHLSSHGRSHRCLC